MMKCKDCAFFHIKEQIGYSKAFCINWENSIFEIKKYIKKCEYYRKIEVE